MATTTERRKAIPLKVKLQVLLSQARCASCGEKLGALDDVEFDHRPPLVMRRWDDAAGDFDPPQNDPQYLQATHCDCHLALTTGRRGEKTVTTRGSDIGEAARVKRIAREHEAFRSRLLTPGAPKRERKSRWPKRKMQSRPFTRS